MKTVLFDRDGTLIIDPPDERVTSEDKIMLFPDTIPALKLLAEADYSIILITNQAGIAEGRIDAHEFERLNSIVIEKLEESGITVYRTYMCPHDPQDTCDCRKPKPKLLLDAITDFGLEPAETFMVGDHNSDILAGNEAGVKTILVKTANVPEEAPEATYTAPTLMHAVEYIIDSAST